MKTLWILLFVLFALLNIYAFTAGDQLSGLWSFLQNLGPWGILAVVDLLIAIVVALHFISRDARRNQISPVPYIFAIILTGSLGILAYMIRHGQPAQQSNNPSSDGLTVK